MGSLLRWAQVGGAGWEAQLDGRVPVKGTGGVQVTLSLNPFSLPCPPQYLPPSCDLILLPASPFSL